MSFKFSRIMVKIKDTITFPQFCKAGVVTRFASEHSWSRPIGYETGIEVFNCVAKSNVPLILRNENFATWYTCGPTVYDVSHIGHGSCYVKVDILQRILREYFNIELVTAMNITDIDDKIIAKTTASVSWMDVATANEISFFDDLKKLNVAEPDIKLRVTEHISEIVEYIKRLVAKDLAYVGKDNSVYFRVNNYPTYGKLQRINIENATHSIKESVADFALWKSSKPNEPAWESPWGPGRPGWHIECSTMASKIFGDTIDFHAGGLDLRFPHHENEETQSCAYHDKSQWVNYWLHTGQLSVKGQAEKMSKSLKNTISIAEFLKYNTSDDFRMACLLSNYKNAMEFSDEMMITAQGTLQKLTSFLSDSQAYIERKKPHVEFESMKIFEAVGETRRLVDIALRNDFDTAKTIGHLMQLASTVSRAINSSETTPEQYHSSNIVAVVAARKFCMKILSVFGIDTRIDSFTNELHSEAIDIRAIIDNIVATRNSLREHGMKTKDKQLFQITDEIRDKLRANGVEIKDHAKESSWYFVRNSNKL